jgi:hypothetical protein
VGLDIIETFMAVEAEFGLEIPDAAAGRMDTVGALFDYVRAHVPAAGAAPAAASPYAGPLWERYLDVLERETGVRRSRLRPEASWVYDLNLD